MQDDERGVEPLEESPLSLSRLRQAFAAMLGDGEVTPSAPIEQHRPANSQDGMQSPEEAGQQTSLSPRAAPCEISPRTVVEAILFVGGPDNRAFSSRELAAAMRGVSPGEIDAAVRELNALYDADEAPYLIEATGAGYRLGLRDDFKRMRDKFYGRVREAKLSPAAIEVLSIVAYNQPVTAEAINELRGAANGAALSTLVRRRLIRLDRPEDGAPRYTTTERFLKLFGLESLDALPRSEELEKA